MRYGANLLLIWFIPAFVVLTSCTKKDDSYLCDDGKCKHGTCSGADCICDTGFKGLSCDQEIPPVKMKISDFLVVDFPARKISGASWDDTDGPDITLMLRKGLDTIWFSDIYYENADTTFAYRFKPFPDIEIMHPADKYTITLMDYEGGTEFEGMSSLTFIPHIGFWDFPKNYTIYHNSAAVSLWVEYFW